jgi:hypothetical protein
MLKDNYNKIEYQSEFMHVFVSVCELIGDEFTSRENDRFWNVVENSSWFSEESKENYNEIIMN